MLNYWENTRKAKQDIIKPLYKSIVPLHFELCTYASGLSLQPTLCCKRHVMNKSQNNSKKHRKKICHLQLLAMWSCWALGFFFFFGGILYCCSLSSSGLCFRYWPCASSESLCLYMVLRVYDKWKGEMAACCYFLSLQHTSALRQKKFSHSLNRVKGVTLHVYCMSIAREILPAWVACTVILVVAR